VGTRREKRGIGGKQRKEDDAECAMRRERDRGTHREREERERENGAHVE
jgi:hypothetical protein